MKTDNLTAGADNFTGMPADVSSDNGTHDIFANGSNDFADEEKARRRAQKKAAAETLFRTDISKMDDAAVAGFYTSCARGLFGIEDPDGKVAFGKRAGDARANVGLLRDFCNGNYSVIRDQEYDKWAEMDEEQKFRYALEHEGAAAKTKGWLEGNRGATLKELAGAGMPGAQFGNVFQNMAAPNRDETIRRVKYENLTPEEQQTYRADVIGRYEDKLSKRQVLATYLAATQDMSDRTAALLADTYNRIQKQDRSNPYFYDKGTIDVDAVEALPDDEKDRFYTALSIMRGDQKKGHLLFMPVDFSDDTALNRAQLALYGFQSSVLDLFSDTYAMGRDAAKYVYGKTIRDDERRKGYFARWDAEERARRALEQGLPEADTWIGEMVQTLGENSHWRLPYGLIARGAKMVKAGKAMGRTAGLRTAVLDAVKPGVMAGVASAEAKLGEVGLAAAKAGKLAGPGVDLWARQMANLEKFSEDVRRAGELANKGKVVSRNGRAVWLAGHMAAFSAFSEEYVANCDAAGISREESVPLSAIVGLVNAKVEQLYVPGLESSLTPAQVKSLMWVSGLRAFRSEGASGFRKWAANYVGRHVSEGVKVTLEEGAVEEPIQQLVTEWGKEVAKSADELREKGWGGIALAWGKFINDNFAADGGFENFVRKGLGTYIDTAVDMVPSSVGFGLTTNFNAKMGQRWRNRARRKENLKKWEAAKQDAIANGREEPVQPRMLSHDESGRVVFNPDGVDYDEGVADVVARAMETRDAIGAYWESKGDKDAKSGNRLVQAVTDARAIWRDGDGDKLGRIAETVGVDQKTAEIVCQYLETESEAEAYSPNVRAWTSINLSSSDISEDTIRSVLPGYVDGSFMADAEGGTYAARVRIADGTERTIAYRVGDISAELVADVAENEKADSAFGRSYDARLKQGGTEGAASWASLSDAERHRIAVDAAARVNGFSSGRAGVLEMKDADGRTVRVNADDVIYLASGRMADIGYSAMAHMGTARHETFHALWRFAATSYTDAQLQEMARALGVDTASDTWRVDLDEAMAHQMEEYASGHYVTHVAETQLEKLLDSGAAKFIDVLSRFGLGDEVVNAKTGRPFALADFYDAVLRGEIGSGVTGVEHVATEAPAPKAESSAAKGAGVPMEVSEAERAAASAELTASQAAEQEPATENAPAAPENAPAAPVNAAPKAGDTLDNPAAASVTDAKFYRISAGEGVDIVGELVVSDARDLKTSYKGTLEDASLQNRGETEEGRALVEKIAARPDPLQVGTVQPRANNGFIWSTPSGNVFIGNTRESGITKAYERGNAENVRAYMLAEAQRRGLEVPEGCEQPVVHFVLRRIESADGSATIQDVVRMTNESVNRGMNVYETARNDADVLVSNNLVPGIALRADGLVDTDRSAAAIGSFRRLTNAQGMIDENTGMLTEEGQTRLSNAVLAALLGNGNADLLRKIVAESARLDIENEKRALMRSAAELMDLAAKKPEFDLRQPLAEALRYYVEWRDADETRRAESGKNRHAWYERTKDGARRRGLTWADHMAQQDMFRTPSADAKLLGDLLAASRDLRSFEADDRETEAGKQRAQRLVADYIGDYIRNARAVNTETVDMFGTPPASRTDVLEAQRTRDGSKRFSLITLSNGQKLVDVDNVPEEIRNEKNLRRKRDLAEKFIRGKWMNKIIDEDGVRAFVNGSTANEYANVERNLDESSWNAKLDAATELEAIVATSTNPRSEPDGKDGHVHKGVKNWEYRDALFRVGDRVYSGKVNIKVLEKTNEAGENLRLLYDVTEIKDITDGIRLLIGNNPKVAFHTDDLKRSLPQASSDVNGENFRKWFAGSKVVDADGNPLVVYRGASFDPLAQEPGKGVIRPESYFSADPEYAKRYGKVNAYYLRITKPFDVRNPEDAKRLSEFYPAGYKVATGHNGALDWGEMANFDLDELREKYPEYDGIILDEGGDPQPDGSVKYRGVSYMPFDGGAQVKSATDNNGEYSLDNRDVRFSISGIYTGSAADYEKPSLQYIGTGEGSQVYGWGLYGSNQRGVADGYAESDALRKERFDPTEKRALFNGKSFASFRGLIRDALRGVEKTGSVDHAIKFLENLSDGNNPEAIKMINWLKSNRKSISWRGREQHEYVYEQTFFTNRAPGDESHLLSWFEPVSDENMSRIANAIKDAGGLFDTYKLPSGATTYIFSDKKAFGNKGTFVKNAGEMPNGVDVYKALSAAYGSPKAASEFLARADIDGVKYPVDSYGGKTVKDGEEAGWNYVSFRDDNINVDHKWVDGQKRFSFELIQDRAIAPENLQEDAGISGGEQTRRFAMRAMDTAARRKDLLALHNVRMDSIQGIAGLGGFAMPSIAVVKDSYLHGEFGDCTVLFDRSSIDPRKRKDNSIYSHDAWTPTFPKIENQIDEKGIKKANDAVVSSIPAELRRVIGNEGYALEYMDGIHDAWDGADDGADAYARNVVMKAAYLVSRGETVEPVMRPRKYLGRSSMRVRHLGEDGLRTLHEKLGRELIDVLEGPGAESEERYAGLAPRVEDVIRDVVWEREYRDDPDVRANGFTKEDCVGKYFSDGHLEWGEMNDIAEAVARYDHDLNAGNADKGEVDEWGTKDAIRTRVDENDPEYRAWINAHYDHPILGKGVYNGKDRFDSRGNRRNWKALHDEATLENIVKAMKKTQRENGSGFLGRNPFGVAVKKFKSVDEMIANEDMLRPLTAQEEKDIKNALSERLVSLASEYMATKKDQDRNKFIEHDRATDMIFDAWEGSRGSFTGMKKLLNGWGYSADDDLTDRIKRTMDEISVMPTNYFEAKPQRPVYFDEMRAWIVPDTIGDAERRTLEANGQLVVTYRKDDLDDRLRAVNEAADRTGTRFSFDSASGPAETAPRLPADYFSKSSDGARHAGRRERGRFSFEFPRLDTMSDDELIAAAVASRIALGKSDKVSERSVKVTTVQKMMKSVHPGWDSRKIGVESVRVMQGAQKMAKRIREDLDRGVSDSLVLEHLPEAMRRQFGSEMRQQARQGARLGTFHQRAASAVEDRQARIAEEAVKVQSGVETKLLENAYGVDLSQTLMNLVENPFLKKDKDGNYVPAGAGKQAAEDVTGVVQEDAPQKEVEEHVRRAVDEVVKTSARKRADEELARRNRENAAGHDAEVEAAMAAGSGDDGEASLAGADVVDIATRREGINLEDPRQLAHFVVELSRRYWIDSHGLKNDANVWADAVAVQFLRKTAANVYGKLAADIAYSQARATAARAIDGFENVPTVQGLLSEMTYVGQVINAKKIRETQQQLCERLDLFLREKLGAQGRFKPDNEELHRKVSAEVELRARYMRHAMRLTPDEAAEEAKEIQREIDIAATDFEGEGHDVDQSRVMVEGIRKLNVLREFGALRYKPVGKIEEAIAYWEDMERGSGEEIAREALDREVRTKKAAAVLARAFHDTARKYAREGRDFGAMLGDYMQSHMGLMNLLRDMTRFASDADAQAAENVFRWLELEIQKAGTAASVEKRRHADALAQAVTKIYGGDFAKVLSEFANEDDRFAPFMGTVDGQRVRPTKGRAIQLMVSLLQVGRKVEVEDPEKPGEFIVQWEGGYHDNIVKFHREAQAAQIAALLTPADLNLVKWLGQWYEGNRQELSGVCESLFGIGVYAETSNYFPVKMLLEKQGLEKGDAVGWSIFPRALTPRVKNERDFDTSADVLQMFMSRMEEGAQWKAHARLGLEMRGIFGRAELQAAIAASHGNKANATVLGFVTDTLAGHGTYDKGDNGATYYTDIVRGWAALGALGANVGVMVRQPTSIPAFGFEIGLAKTAKHMLTAFTPEGMAAMRRIFDSDQRKVRWDTGNTEAVKNALAATGSGPIMRLWKASMITNRVGDVVPALVVGQGIYRECLEKGMSEDDAMAYTWMLVERTQQSSRIENQAQFQRRSKYGRAIYQFLSTQQQYLQYELRAVRAVMAKPGDASRWAKLGGTLALNHFILSSAYFWVGAMFRRLLGQEPPEDELKDWTVSMLLGPYGALYGLGITCTGALNEWIKGPQYGGTSSLPSLSYVGNVIVRDPAAVVKAILDDGSSWDDVLEKLGKWAADQNALFRDMRKIKKNYFDKE